MMSNSYKEIDISEIPLRVGRNSEWFDKLMNLPLGKAGVLTYNNRQRAYQVVYSIRNWAEYHKNTTLKVVVRGFSVHFWLEDAEDISAEEAKKMIEKIPGYPRKKHTKVEAFKV